MTEPFIIRPARVDDADAIAHVHHQSWEETYPGLMPPELLERVSLEHRLKQWRRIIHDEPEGGARFVAEASAGYPSGVATTQTIIGIAQCGPAREPELNARHEIWMIYVLREAQKQGVGAALMRAMFDYLRSLDDAASNPDRSVGLWVLKGNDTAIRFYEKHGFAQTGAIKRDERMGVTLEDISFVSRNLKQDV